MPSRVQLREEYVAGMFKPIVLVAAIIATSAPTAYHLLSRNSLRREAELTARRVAAMVSGTAEERPRLWQYDTLKILGELREYIDQPDVAAVVLLDRYGREVPLGTSRGGLSSPAWGIAPVHAHNRSVGTIAIAMDGGRVDALSLAMLAVFLSLGLSLSYQLYRQGVRTVAKAERRIKDLVQGLETARLTLTGELGDTRSRLQELVDQALALRETERTSIARDLHDGVGQVLCGLRLRLDLLAEDLPNGERRAETRELIRLVEAATAEIRRASATLATPPPEQKDLRAALQTMCARVSTDRFIVSLTIGQLAKVSGPQATSCYRIVQEAIANAARHALTSAVHVEVGTDPAVTTLWLRVHDEGRGFDPETARGLGIDSMQARAAAHGGRLQIESAPGAGCTVRAALQLGDAGVARSNGGSE